jgi:hypothetical protein
MAMKLGDVMLLNRMISPPDASRGMEAEPAVTKLNADFHLLTPSSPVEFLLEM